MSSKRKAEKLYSGFRDQSPTRTRRMTVPKYPKAVAVLGYLTQVEYATTQNVDGTRKAIRRYHPFAAGSRPLLCSDGKRLYILKGRFRVTARGIVDLDSQGREEQ